MSFQVVTWISCWHGIRVPSKNRMSAGPVKRCAVALKHRPIELVHGLLWVLMIENIQICPGSFRVYTNQQ